MSTNNLVIPDESYDNIDNDKEDDDEDQILSVSPPASSSSQSSPQSLSAAETPKSALNRSYHRCLIALQIVIYLLIIAIVAVLNTVTWLTEPPYQRWFHTPGLYATVKGFNVFFAFATLCALLIIAYRIGNRLLSIADLRRRAQYNLSLYLWSALVAITIPFVYMFVYHILLRYSGNLSISSYRRVIIGNSFALIAVTFVALNSVILFVGAIFCWLTALLVTLRSFNVFQYLLLKSKSKSKIGQQQQIEPQRKSSSPFFLKSVLRTGDNSHSFSIHDDADNNNQHRRSTLVSFESPRLSLDPHKDYRLDRSNTTSVSTPNSSVASHNARTKLPKVIGRIPSRLQRHYQHFPSTPASRRLNISSPSAYSMDTSNDPILPTRFSHPRHRRLFPRNQSSQQQKLPTLIRTMSGKKIFSLPSFQSSSLSSPSSSSSAPPLKPSIFIISNSSSSQQQQQQQQQPAQQTIYPRDDRVILVNLRSPSYHHTHFAHPPHTLSTSTPFSLQSLSDPLPPPSPPPPTPLAASTPLPLPHLSSFPSSSLPLPLPPPAFDTSAPTNEQHHPHYYHHRRRRHYPLDRTAGKPFSLV